MQAVRPSFQNMSSEARASAQATAPAEEDDPATLSTCDPNLDPNKGDGTDEGSATGSVGIGIVDGPSSSPGSPAFFDSWGDGLLFDLPGGGGPDAAMLMGMGGGGGGGASGGANDGCPDDSDDDDDCAAPPPRTALRRYSSEPVPVAAHGPRAAGETAIADERLMLGLGLGREAAGTPPILIGGVGFEGEEPGRGDGGGDEFDCADCEEDGDGDGADGEQDGKERSDSWGTDCSLHALSSSPPATGGTPSFDAASLEAHRRRWAEEDMAREESSSSRSVPSAPAGGGKRHSITLPVLRRRCRSNRGLLRVRSIRLPKRSMSWNNVAGLENDDWAIDASIRSQTTCRSTGYAGPPPVGPDGRPLKSCLSRCGSSSREWELSSSFSGSGHNFNGAEGGMRRSVSFNVITVREYERTLGDHPCVSSGPALGLGWAYNESDAGLSVDQYEKEKPATRTKAQLLMPKGVREDVLKEQANVSRAEIARATREANEIKVRRMRTAKAFIPAQQTLELAAELAKRKVRRVLSGTSKRREEEMLWEEARRRAVEKAAAADAAQKGQAGTVLTASSATTTATTTAAAGGGGTDFTKDDSKNNVDDEWGFGYDED